MTQKGYELFLHFNTPRGGNCSFFFVQKAGFMLVEVSFARNVKEKRNVVITVRP